MTEPGPSATALFVAFMRGVATHERDLARVCQDPCAAVLLPPRLARMVDASSRHDALASALRTVSCGMFDHIALRSALIDRALSQGLERGIDQVVLLGAGLDARAHRLPALAHARVFELDQPATQRLKRKRAADLPLHAREIRYAPCDFTRESLDSALMAAGFDATRPTAWIWEGVTMYLTRDAVRDTLRRIAALSVPDSLLICTYLTPDLVAGGTGIARIGTRLLARLSEPIRFTSVPSEFATLLSETDFAVLNDAAPKDAAPHFGVEKKRPTSFTPKERIAVAIKRGKQS